MIINLSDQRGKAYLVRQPPTSLYKQVGGYMRLDNLQLPRITSNFLIVAMVIMIILVIMVAMVMVVTVILLVMLVMVDMVVVVIMVVIVVMVVLVVMLNVVARTGQLTFKLDFPGNL